MFENEHTPGPWKVEGEWIKNVRNNKEKELPICKMAQENWNDQKDANAKVIAAAPALLKSLKTIMSHAMLIINVNHPDYREAVSALAQAEPA